MAYRTFVFLIISACLSLSGCLSEPDGLNCPEGNQLRLADNNWICDQDRAVADIPKTRQHFYVDAKTGADSNTGSREAPWKTIVKAASTVEAGSTVYIRNGTYDDGPIEIANSGSAENPIVFTAKGLASPIIQTNGIQAVGKSHITIAHLEFQQIRGVNGNAIRIEGRDNQDQPAASNILIKGNRIIDTWSSGIAIWGVSYRKDPGSYNNIRDVIIESNTLELNTNGGANEIITVANGASNIDVRYNTIRYGDFNEDGTPDGTGDEGIDFKEGVRDSRIYSNTIYDLSDKGIYIDGGRGENTAGVAINSPTVTNVDIYNNRIRDGWGGIAVTTEGRGNVSGVNIYNNVVSGIVRDGIIVRMHPYGEEAGGQVDNVWIFNNTVTESGHGTPPGRKYWGGIRSSHPQASVLIENNITWQNSGFDISKHLTNTSIAAINTHVNPNNLCRESLCIYNEAPDLTTDATPSAQSPALNAGNVPQLPHWLSQLPLPAAANICGIPRAQGRQWDLGAIETPFTGNTATPELLDFCVRP